MSVLAEIIDAIPSDGCVEITPPPRNMKIENAALAIKKGLEARFRGQGKKVRVYSDDDLCVSVCDA